MSEYIYAERPTGGRTIRLNLPGDASGSGLIPPGKVTFMQWIGPTDEHVPVDFYFVQEADQ